MQTLSVVRGRQVECEPDLEVVHILAQSARCLAGGTQRVRGERPAPPPVRRTSARLSGLAYAVRSSSSAQGRRCRARPSVLPSTNRRHATRACANTCPPTSLTRASASPTTRRLVRACLEERRANRGRAQALRLGFAGRRTDGGGHFRRTVPGEGACGSQRGRRSSTTPERSPGTPGTLSAGPKMSPCFLSYDELK